MKKLVLTFFAFLAAYAFLGDGPDNMPMGERSDATLTAAAQAGRSGATDGTAANRSIVPTTGYSQQDAGRQIQNAGVVIRLLPDDNNGARHQRFILRLPSGQTLLIVHNIDIAPRIDGLALDDEVTFNGEYEFNSQGGVVHWTHRDPAGRHVAGWLQHADRTYQ